MKTINYIFNRYFTALILYFVSYATFAAEEFPIVAYYGVPHSHASETRYKELKEAGFNISIDNYKDVNDAIKCLNYAEKSAIKLILAGNYIQDPKVKDFVTKVKNHNALYGYSLKDEPQIRDYNNVVSIKNAIKEADGGQHPFYLNLFPNYGNWMLKHIGVKNYCEYLNKYCELDIPQISFDFYPFTKNGERKEWYLTLMDIRKASLKHKKPFWGFILLTPHSVYKQPTYTEIKLQAYVNLAFGAQGLQYFTYWTPPTFKDNNFYNAPISANGEKTGNYKLVKKLNSEIKKYTEIFHGAKMGKIGCIGKIPDGMMKYDHKKSQFGKIYLEVGESVIISTFSKDKDKYVAIVNRDINKKARISFQNIPITFVYINKEGKVQKANKKYLINKGDLLLFKIKK